MATLIAAQVFVIWAVSLVHCNVDDIPSSAKVNEWANQLGVQMREDFMSASDYDRLQDSYDGSIRDSVQFKSVQPEEELAKMASKITNIFTKRTQALKDIVNRAEELTLTYHYDNKVQLSDDKTVIEDGEGQPLLDVPLFKMADHSAASGELSPSPALGREVNTSLSGLHTPLEVYEGYVDVLNGLIVTAGLDETFRANLARDPDISWQYLGTQLGFLRVFPATWWQPPASLGVDLYDVRRRPWYIEGSVSPKDVVILMDISGSVHGQTFEIMKIAVKTVLNTLGENDYVNIAWSTNQVGWVNPCMKRLVPATMINKRALAAAVDAMEARNTSNLAKGLEFAYRAFIDFYTTEPEHAGAKCHKLIMFFSDGGTEWPGSVIEKYKNETLTENVRLFTYALGPHPVPSHIMRTMACNNSGSFSVIVASGAIRTSIQESYLSVLGKPLALSSSHPLAGSPPYLDALGLGYVTTLSMPVFNRSTDSTDGPSLMGVAGVDISMKEILRHAPWKKLGPFGYTFAINPNGIVVFHPYLREPLHYMEDPPDLDLTQLEGEAVVDLRRLMIRRNSDSVELERTVVPLPDGHRLELRRVQYFCRPIDNTTLSLGLMLPVSHKYLVASGQEVRRGLPDCAACLLPPSWDYCPDLSGNSSQRWRQLDQLLRAGGRDCSQDLVQHLLWDVNWTAVAPTVWANNVRNESDGVLGRFLITDGGLTRFHPADSGADLTSESEPYRGSLYRQAALADDLVIRPRPDSQRLLAAKRMVVAYRSGDVYPIAVAGVQFSSGWLWGLADRVLREDGSDQPVCSREASVLCWLLDSAGRVVYASGEMPPARNDTEDGGGPHLGVLDPELMAALVNASVYQQTTEYDYQAVCKKSSPDASAGSPLRDPLSWLNVQLLLDSVSGLLRWLDYLRYLITSWLLSAQSAPVSALDEFGFEIQADSHACTQRVTRTQRAEVLRPYEGEARCHDGGCRRLFRASLVDGTNLLLVVANTACDCPELAGGADLAYQPTEDVGPDRCDDRFNQTALFRRRPDTCYATHENEKPACSAAGCVPPLSLLSLLMAALLSAGLGGC